MVGFLFLTSGCLTAPPTSTPANNQPDLTTPPENRTATTTNGGQTLGKQAQAALDPRLVDLLRATDRQQYATDHHLTLRNGSVLVVIQLKQNRSLPHHFRLSVEARYAQLVQVWVPMDRLSDLAAHQNVTVVRPPLRPSVDDTPTNDANP